jgi:hypothetical protein
MKIVSIIIMGDLLITRAFIAEKKLHFPNCYSESLMVRDKRIRENIKIFIVLFCVTI